MTETEYAEAWMATLHKKEEPTGKPGRPSVVRDGVLELLADGRERTSSEIADWLKRARGLKATANSVTCLLKRLSCEGQIHAERLDCGVFAFRKAS